MSKIKPLPPHDFLQNHSIGRVAVLKSYRGLGVGKVLMQAVIAYAQQQQRLFLVLSSQVHAQAFYQALGFMQEGEEYLDCGIPHIHMRLSSIKKALNLSGLFY